MAPADRPPAPSAAEVIADLEAQHRRELRKLYDGGFAFLSATDGDSIAAENLFEDFVSLLFEGGSFCLWRYRAILSVIREGL